MEDNTPNDPIVEVCDDVISADPDVVNERQQRLRVLFEREPEIMNEVKHYFELLKIDYAHRVTEIESFLGFAESSAELGTRLHNLERFVGIKA